MSLLLFNMACAVAVMLLPSTSSAFLFHTKPHATFYSSTLHPTSTKAPSIGFLFDRKLNHFQRNQSTQSTNQPPIENNDDDDVMYDDENKKQVKPTTPQVVVDTNAPNTVRSTGFVYVAVDGLLSQILEIEVTEGDSVASIKRKVKEEKKNDYALYDYDKLILFRSNVTTALDAESTLDDVEMPLNPLGKALLATQKWNPTVTWGSEDQPLIVKVKQIAKESVLDSRIVNVTKLGQFFINSIMSDYIDIPDIDDMKLDIPMTSGMKFLKNVIDLETTSRSNVIVRSITEKYWCKVIEACDTFRVCALGTPGIGKSTSTCILIRLLLLQNKTVAYLIRKKNAKGLVYLFSPLRTESEDAEVADVKTSKIKAFEADVKVIRENEFDDSNEHFNNRNLYFIVDPGETKDSCSPGTDFVGKLIIVTSPFEGHWGEREFHKGRGRDSDLSSDDLEMRIFFENNLKRVETIGAFLYYPIWTLPELLASYPYITKAKLNTSTVRDRFFKFGGVPRYIFASNILGNELAQSEALSALSLDTAIDLAKTDRTAIQSFTDKTPRGILLAYVLSENDDGSFRYAHATLSSDFVYESFTNRFMGQLWEQIVPSCGKFDPYLFETFCAVSLCDSEQPKKQFFLTRFLNQTKEKTIRLNQCFKREKVYNIVQAARDKERVLFLPVSPTYKLIDFGYRDGNTYHFFQCTTGSKHSANPLHIYELVLEVLSKTEEEISLVSMAAVDVPQVKIYYAVPEFRFDEFVSEHPNATIVAREYCMQKQNSTISDNRTKEIHKLWNSIVSIDILRIERPNIETMPKIFSDDKMPLDQVSLILKKVPGLYEELLNTNIDHLENIDSMILNFTTIKLRECLRCLTLPVSGKNKNVLVERLQDAMLLFAKLIKQLQNEYK